MSYSKAKQTDLVTAKEWSITKAKEKRLKASILSHLMDSYDQDLPHNQFITFARPALPIQEASAMLKFQQFCRILRVQAKALGRQFSYLWMAGIGIKQGYHIHMTLYWPSYDKARLHHNIARFWDAVLSPIVPNSVVLKSNCSSISLKPLTISNHSYESIALYFSAHISKHAKQPEGRSFGKSVLKTKSGTNAFITKNCSFKK
jgi:hypothetical protein